MSISLFIQNITNIEHNIREYIVKAYWCAYKVYFNVD